jgi:hypothetical protein
MLGCYNDMKYVLGKLDGMRTRETNASRRLAIILTGVAGTRDRHARSRAGRGGWQRIVWRGGRMLVLDLAPGGTSSKSLHCP